MAEHTEIVVPDLDLPGTEIRASVWHVRCNQDVAAGDRILEIVAGEVSYDIPAPAAGRLTRKCVEVDEKIEPDQRVAVLTLAGSTRS